MSINTRSITWNEWRALPDLLVADRNDQADYLIVQAEPHPVITAAMIPATSSTELIVFLDTAGTQRWSKLSNDLPLSAYFLAVLPSAHPAIAISTRAIAANSKLISESQSWNEFVVRLSAAATISFVDHVKHDSALQFQCPRLTLAEGEWHNPWIRELIQQLPGPKNHSSSTPVVALKAGLFLVNDFFNDSHSCSQSIEGLGSQHTGDYWHAILHRREPDYGNAKYWFRHVGRHPAYLELKQRVDRHLNEANGLLASKLERWKTKLISRDSWDPFAFVDLCAAAESDVELQSWCEQVQYDEMLLLLESSARDAFKLDNER